MIIMYVGVKFYIKDGRKLSPVPPSVRTLSAMYRKSDKRTSLRAARSFYFFFSPGLSSATLIEIEISYFG